jgi:hypothetical protein
MRKGGAVQSDANSSDDENDLGDIGFYPNCPPSSPVFTEWMAGLAKGGLINGFGCGMEYMITHAGLITANPALYHALTGFSEKYLVSPLGLIGRGAVWLGRGLLAAAVPEERPDNFAQVVRKAGFDLLAYGLVSVTYQVGSRYLGYYELLAERVVVDTVGVSVVSAGLESIYSNSRGVTFWGKGRDKEEFVHGSEEELDRLRRLQYNSLS